MPQGVPRRRAEFFVMANLLMTPAPGDRLVRYVGDRIRFNLRLDRGESPPEGWRASLRTNLGRVSRIRDEILHAHFHQVAPAGDSWHDIPMRATAEGWEIDLTLAEVGFFKAKAYATDKHGHQHWPPSPDFGLSVHPDLCRTSNTIYCAFTRQFGDTRKLASNRNEPLNEQLRQLDEQGYTVIPPSGKLRDLTQQLPHIMGDLGFRILHLLPINPTPTTYARYGRFGSPYACQDFTAIDPALVEFDRRTTGVDQFRELAYGVHERDGRLILDVVINHTGWGATLQETHPEWYLRSLDGSFVSPGAWGVTWEDLAELHHTHSDLWVHLSETFLTWCRRGVDGFRCDAGYKVPLPAWQYIISRVRQEFPNALFLLEGLGGPWSTTEELLTEGGMQWAYSELFQNNSPTEVSGYLDYAIRQSERVGTYIHYSETHDNNRLAANSRTWSLLRNQLSALTSVSGGFGITGGVEWLAAEKISVHGCAGLGWGATENIVPTLAHLNQLLATHPCFFDGAQLRRLSSQESAVFALGRTSATGEDRVLVLVNTDPYHEQHFVLPSPLYGEFGEPHFELIGHARPKVDKEEDGSVRFTLLPAACLCLAGSPQPVGLHGEAYRQSRSRAAWAIQALGCLHPQEALGEFNWQTLAQRVDDNPVRFLTAAVRAEQTKLRVDLDTALEGALQSSPYTPVVTWSWASAQRTTLLPPRHWLMLREKHPFRACLSGNGSKPPQHVESVPTRQGHIAGFFNEGSLEETQTLTVERYGAAEREISCTIRMLSKSSQPQVSSEPAREDLVLLTNGRGAMARLGVSLGDVRSKYDCALAANLHPHLPTDRHVFVKRVRMWVLADGFIRALSADALVGFVAGPPARWQFEINAGDGRRVRLDLEADMLEGRNSTVFRLSRSATTADPAHCLPAGSEVSVTIRVDLEDRNFHWETKRNESANHHFLSHSAPLSDRSGFLFNPAGDRTLQVFTTAGSYHHEAEWSLNLRHPVEQSRGQEGAGDAFSPGWFSVPLKEGQSAHLVLSADPTPPSPAVIEQFQKDRQHRNDVAFQRSGLAKNDRLGRQLAQSAQAFVVRRDEGRTVIAGYPWFLDWGRDSLICARGLLAAGWTDEVRQLAQVFARFESQGTLPNTIHGENASNRDTSDAPLWLGVVVDDLAGVLGRSVYATQVEPGGRTLGTVLRSIGVGYRDGTPNGIHMDPASALIWSPSHFTWMDTNYPAGTPREGYPVEIQVLWIRLLRQLAQIEDAVAAKEWQRLADRAFTSFQHLFWLEERGYLADLLIASKGTPASEATVDNALRSNSLFAVSLGLVVGEKARRTVQAAADHLVIPGALRSLAPLPVDPPLPIHSANGTLLNDPQQPYWGHYEGDEDTQRKPAYHNGTAWTWTFPTFCEALALAWDRQPAALAAAKAYLGSVNPLMENGCIGHLPEVLDGNYPHNQRGCDAQAWGTTEALRVWRWLHR